MVRVLEHVPGCEFTVRCRLADSTETRNVEQVSREVVHGMGFHGLDAVRLISEVCRRVRTQRGVR